MATPTASNPAFRKTAAATKLGKALFSKNSQTKITPAQITNLLRLSGVNVPPSVVVTADVAQIIMAGGMIASNVNRAAAIRSYGAPTALAIQAALELLTVCGLADAESPMIQMLKYGAEVAAVVSSMGTNVVADLSLALDTYQQVSKSTRGKSLGALEFFTVGIGLSAVDEAIFGSGRIKDLSKELQGEADLRARNKVLTAYQAAQQAQVSDAGAALLDYQAGRISIFSFMGHLAEQEPLVFYNYFPQLKVFLPPHFLQLSVTNRIQFDQTGGIFNLASKHYDIRGGYTQTFETSAQYSRDQIIQAIINYFLKDSNIYNMISGLNGFVPVMKLDNIRPETRISMADIACLSMFPPYFEKIDSLNLVPILSRLGLTPHDLGYEFVEDMKTNFHIFPEVKNVIAQTPALTWNGVNYFSDYQRGVQEVLKKKQLLIDQLVEWDMNGDIQNLGSNSTGLAMVKKWSDAWGQVSDELKKSIAELGETPNLAKMQLNLEAAKNIKNFFSFMSIANLMKDDSYISSTVRSKREINDRISYMTGSAQSLDDRMREIQTLSLGRLMNAKAIKNIFSFFDVPVKMGPIREGQLAYVI